MRLIDADALKKVIHCAYSDDLEILDKIDNAPTITPKEFEPLLEAIMDALPVIVEKTVPAIVEKTERALEAIQTVIDDTNGNIDNVSKAMRNTAKFIKNAINGEMPDYENVEGEDCGERPTEKCAKREFIKILVEYGGICPYKEYEGKPYFSVIYRENGEMYCGYGTYNPDVLSQYIRDYFIE